MKTIFTFLACCFFAFLYIPNAIQAQGCLDAAIYLGQGSNTMFAFRGDDCINMQWSQNMFGAPADINSEFPGIDAWTHIDAGFEPNNGTFALISGPNISIFDKSTNASIQLVPLTSLYNFLPAHFQEGIDAAFSWHQGSNTERVFFFKGTETLAFDWNHDTNTASFASGPNEGGWNGLFTHFPNGIDAAAYYNENNKLYFFSGNQYIRYDGVTGTIDPNYPATFNNQANWGDYPAEWSCNDALFNGDCNIGYQLPDNGCGQGSSVDIDITDAPGSAIGSDVALTSVAIYLEHTWIADMDITLISPSGQAVELTKLNGGDGDNFGSSCNETTIFDDNATTSIASGSAPFVGSYQPLESLSGFNDGSNPNGAWQLQMCDNQDEDTGILQYVKLNFGTLTSVEAVEDKTDEIKIYPSPNDGRFTVEWDGEGIDAAQIVIRNLTGKTIFVNKAAISGQQQIDLGDVPKGIYLVQIQTEDRMVTKKITIQ